MQGSEAWWNAIEEARTANDEHMQEEEHDDLPDFRRHVSTDLRDEVGEKFQQFKKEHAGGAGLTGEDVDPDRFIEENKP